MILLQNKKLVPIPDEDTFYITAISSRSGEKYTLKHESEGYIFRRDGKGYGASGHYFTKGDAIHSAISLNMEVYLDGQLLTV